MDWDNGIILKQELGKAVELDWEFIDLLNVLVYTNWEWAHMCEQCNHNGDKKVKKSNMNTTPIKNATILNLNTISKNINRHILLPYLPTPTQWSINI